MPVHASQIDRIVWSRRAQEVVRRPLLLGPIVLIPAAAKDPFAWPRRRDSTTDAPDHFFAAARASQVDVLECCAKADNVRMGIVKPWNDRAAADVDEACRGSLQANDLGFPADPYDSIASGG